MGMFSGLGKKIKRGLDFAYNPENMGDWAKLAALYYGGSALMGGGGATASAVNPATMSSAGTPLSAASGITGVQAGDTMVTGASTAETPFGGFGWEAAADQSFGGDKELFGQMMAMNMMRGALGGGQQPPQQMAPMMGQQMMGGSVSSQQMADAQEKMRKRIMGLI